MKLNIGKYQITIHGTGNNKALVLMHEDHEESGEVWELLSEDTKSRITLAGISGISWEADLTPWEAPPLFKKAKPFAGEADRYSRELTECILPEIRKAIAAADTASLIDTASSSNMAYSAGTKYRSGSFYIAGYSLAGLFAIYAALETDIFDGLVSASGSVWYPDFLAYAKSHSLPSHVKAAYFSVGDKEAKTKNAMMQPVEENTREIEARFRQQGIHTKFELNSGGHFTEDSLRLAKGINWLAAVKGGWN